MKRVGRYRKYIRKIIARHSYLPAYGDAEVQQIFDTEHDHYQLVHTGWYESERLYGCILHLDIRDDRIWIQYDGTETGIADELAELGVPKEDIVLAYHPPYKRPYTGFGPDNQH
ncbi:XisI protein [Candidatus Electrothrix aarhusensis]|uniref:XisI protein n=1 Tax=Candidatus Electrothrix aarhusensis TaxID=1859131 RepID=A0A3S3RNQ1_9BACT|nr:XisI protein [Candidatus Electrothrix aarhusensis]